MALWKKLLITSLLLGTVSLGCNEKKEEKISYGNLEVKTKEDSLNELKNKPTFVYSPKALERYNQWVDSTLSESVKDSSNAIIISKSDYTLYLIKNGKVDSQYNIELGFNPIEDKQREGDCRTPEGMYIVRKKLPLGYTGFHKAFLINYPNKEDKKQGKTGGLIEIHGNGSGNKGNDKGYNWTLGCVATSNENMDKIFPYIEERNRITIVGHITKI